ncbi:hypothetical protein [Sphingobacterium sp.]|uniref:hypothetical protein n=1 Tax=Sphingobacterium sp. TaxID=341027 RepID=UPI0028A6671F|nr:hypothetical protein [Sphingobacterium sp.]
MRIVQTDRRIIAVLFTMSVIVSCSSDDPESSPKEIHYVMDVYATGYERKDLKNVAKIWMNGMEQHLSDGKNNAQAYAMTVSGKDVHVVGYEKKGKKDVAVLWMNGIRRIDLDMPLRSLSSSPKSRL